MGPACQFLVKEKGQGGCIRAQRGWAGSEAQHLGMAQPGPRLGYMGWLKGAARRSARVRGSAYWAGRGWRLVFFFFFLFSFSSRAVLGRRGTGSPLPSFSSFLLHFPPRLTAWPLEQVSSPLTGSWGPPVGVLLLFSASSLSLAGGAAPTVPGRGAWQGLSGGGGEASTAGRGGRR